MSVARALFAGPGARRALVDGADGEVEFVLSQGAYVRLGAEWLGLADPAAPFGPLSVVIRGRLDIRPGAPAYVTGSRLVVGDSTVSLERMRHRTSAVARVSSARACASLPAPPARLEPGIAALAGARVIEAVRLLAGLGDGLTPAGDDVLAGYAAARLTLGQPVAISPLAAGRASPLGLAYLRCAERGELPDVAWGFLDAVCRGAAGGERAAVASLRAWGATSGIGLAWGINAAVSSLTERVRAGART